MTRSTQLLTKLTFLKKCIKIQKETWINDPLKQAPSAVLPIKDKTSGTTVRNLYGLFPYIYDSLTNLWIRHSTTIFNTEDSIKHWKRHI